MFYCNLKSLNSFFSRRLDVRRLITHQFPLDQTAAAIGTRVSSNAESLKIVVNQVQSELFYLLRGSALT